jgi:SRSO17 transposase
VVYRLYLPQDWAKDAERRSKVGVPADISLKTKSLTQKPVAHALVV